MPSQEVPSPPTRRHAVVIGAGIGGLTAAIALTRAGLTVAVHERAATLAPVGAGLTVQPNAVLALRRIGIAEPIERLGVRLLIGAPTSSCTARAIAGGNAASGRPSARKRPPLLARRDHRPRRFCRRLGRRGLDARPRPIGALRRLRDRWRTLLLVRRRQRARGRHGPAGHGQSPLLAMFKGAKLPIEAVIAATPDDHILRHDIAHRAPQSRWGEGAMTLLGDAAHPMTPNLGQGACQAVEDALVVGDALGGANAARPVAESLRAYEARRQARVHAVVLGARRFGAMGQWNHPVACWLRNGLVRAVPTGVLRKRLAAGWRLPD